MGFEAKMKILKYYPYRKGFIRGSSVLQFPIEPMRDFQKMLAQIAGVDYDNHTCFLVEMEDSACRERIVAFMFSDHIMYMGDRIEEKVW